METPHNYYHELIKRHAVETDKFFFIQIGANDGKRFDPLHGHITKERWSGILIEPVPYIFKKLVENYKKIDYIDRRKKNLKEKIQDLLPQKRVVLQKGFSDKIVFLNTAIAEINGKKNFYRIKENNDPKNPPWYDQIGSFREEVILKHSNPVPDFAKRFIEEEVDCITFEKLIENEKVEKIDLLNIDTEGYDYEIIKLINFENIKPSMILYEHKHLTEKEQEECEKYLEEKGYKIITQAGDTFAYNF